MKAYRIISALSGAVLAVLLLALTASAAEGDSLWTRHYGGSGFEYAYAICPAGDGGFLLAGQTNSFGAGGYDMYLLKVSAQGDSLWSRAYGGSGDECAYSLTPSGDGGFLLAGQTFSFDPFDSQTYLVKVNAQGDLQWSRHYGTGADEYARSIIPSGDGGFLMAGSTDYGPTGNDMWLLKVNAQSDSLWSYAYGGYDLQWAYSIVPAGDGNFVMAGWTTAGLNPDQMQMVKVNSLGNQIWSIPYGDYYYGDEEAYAICPSGDGGFVLAGRITAYFTQMYESYVVRTDAAGDTLWTRTFGGVEEDWTNAVIPSGDGGFLLAGQSGGYGATSWDAWLVKVNSQGDSLWARTYGTTREEYCRAIVSSEDGGYMLAGYTSPDTVGWNWQMYLVKVEGPFMSAPPPVTTQPAMFAFYPPHPNPFNPTTVLTFDLPVASQVKLEVFDINGRNVGAGLKPAPTSGSGATPTTEMWLPAGTHQITFDGSDLPSGIYLAKLTAGNFSQVQKMVLLK